MGGSELPQRLTLLSCTPQLKYGRSAALPVDQGGPLEHGAWASVSQLAYSIGQ